MADSYVILNKKLIPLSELKMGAKPYDSEGACEDYDHANNYGMELVLNLGACDPEAIRSREKILEYARKLCKVIGMKPFGEPWAERFGLNAAKTAGYSLVQLIETSSVTGHFSELWNKAYINIFSCKEFDAAKAEEFTKKFFGAKAVRSHRLIR